MTINLLTQLDLHTIPQCIHTCLSQFANCLYYSIQLATPTLAPSLTSTPTMAQSQPQLENSTPQPAHNTPLALTLNCGYFRTAIRELVPKRKGIHGRTFAGALQISTQGATGDRYRIDISNPRASTQKKRYSWSYFRDKQTHTRIE